MIKAMILALGCSALLAAPAIAKNSGTLPKGAVEMTSAQLTAILAGNSIDYTVAKYYLAPDGSLSGINQKKDAFGTGTWTVKGNEFCLDSSWRGKDHAAAPYHYAGCKKFWMVGKTLWVQNSKDSDQYQGDIYDGFSKNLRKGNIIGDKAQKLKTKFGYTS